jgi:hypothetical protein
MNKKILGAILGVGVLVASASASAHVDVAVGIGVPGVYAAPQAVYGGPPVAVAYGGDGGGYGYDDRRERAWRHHEWREQQWRREAWREHRWQERHGWGGGY